MSMDNLRHSIAEHTMAYGWVILVLIVLGVVLYQNGLLWRQSNQSGCQGFSRLEVTVQKASKSGTMEFLVLNDADAGFKILKDDIQVSMLDIDCNSPSNAPDADIDPLDPGDSLSAIVSCTGMADHEDYRANIRIRYTHVSSGVVHNSYGQCWGPIE